MNKSVFHHLSYGVYLVTAFDAAQNRHTGCVVNSIMQVSSAPATVAVSISHDNYTNACVKASGRLAVSILPEAAPPKLIGLFGFASGKDTDKFAATPHTMRDGLAVPNAAMSYFTGTVTETLETATHTVFLLRVEEGDVLQDGAPMSYAYYRTVIKGKTPKNAPSYTEPEATEKQWVCTICHYRYDGDVPFEDLPEDYECPICSAGKAKFELQ